MDDETTNVCSGQAETDPWEDEAAKREDAREAYRRRLLSAIRGRLRENRGLRWSVAAILTGCGLFAWLVALELHTQVGYRWLWLPGAGIMAAWPVFIIAMYLRARLDSRLLDADSDWNTLHQIDLASQIQDNEMDDKVRNFASWIWPDRSRTYSSSASGDDFWWIIACTFASAGLWAVSDLLMTSPSMIAEIILDGILVPSQPGLRDQIPTYPWYKNLMINTGVHFLVAAAIATIITALWSYGPGYHH